MQQKGDSFRSIVKDMFNKLVILNHPMQWMMGTPKYDVKCFDFLFFLIKAGCEHVLFHGISSRFQSVLPFICLSVFGLRLSSIMLSVSKVIMT